MRWASWVFGTMVVTAVAACSLTTSLSGLSNGDVSEATDGGDASMMLDARSEASRDDDGGGSADADGGARYREIVLADAPLAYYRLGDQGATAKDEVGGPD